MSDLDPTTATDGFADLLQANRRWAETADVAGFDGIARAGVALITCMDSRIDPLAMLGLGHGDAKIMRTPGGHVTPDAVVGCVLGVHLLGVRRIMVIPHTRCAMASGTDAEIAALVRAGTGAELGSLRLDADPDQVGRLRSDLRLLRENPLIAGRAEIGGFSYDVDTGLLEQIA